MIKKASLTFIVLFFACSFVGAQEHPEIDTNRRRAQDLEEKGNYLEAAAMYKKAVEAERGSADREESNLFTYLTRAGYCCSQAGHYRTAVEYIEEALAIAGKLEQEENIAACLSLFGGVYKSLEKHDVAIGYYEEALDIYRKLGQEENVAANLNYIGDTYASREQLDNAIRYLEEALGISRKLGLKDRTATLLSSIGSAYETMGRYDTAIEYYENALAIDRKQGNEKKAATGLNHIGDIYKFWNQYDTAIRYYENALEIYRRLEQEETIVSQLSHIGTVYKFMGKYDTSGDYFQEALTLDRKSNRMDNVVADLNNLGEVYRSEGQYESAFKCFEEAYDTACIQGYEEKAAAILKNIGAVYETLKQYDRAIVYYEDALGLDRKLAVKASNERNLKNLDLAYNYYWTKHDKIFYPHEMSLAIKKKSETEMDVSGDLNRIGKVHVLREEYKTAINYFIESMDMIERLLHRSVKEESTEARRKYLAGQLNTYQLLASAYTKDNDVNSALRTIELSRAKLLSERLDTNERKIRLETEEIQSTLDDDSVIIVYENVNREEMIQIAITRKDLVGKEIPGKSFVQSSIGKYRPSLDILSITQHNPGGNNHDFETIINYYGSLLRTSSLQNEKGRKECVNKLRESIRKTNIENIGRSLYGLLIKPIEAQVQGKKNLIIVPGDILTFLPFETFIDENGQYLAENHNIIYMPSVEIRDLIKKRKYDKERNPLLAFGGAVYEGVDYGADTIENERQQSIITRNIYSDLDNLQKSLMMKNLYPDFENVRYIRNAYVSLGIGSWHSLPGTLSEIYDIREKVNKSNIFTGEDVSEEKIKEFSKNWTLYSYKALHFATHGLLVPQVPELSALVLSQCNGTQDREDGYLRMEEIAKLEIQADLVSLSAFDSGLGKTHTYRGLTEFTQSFLLAGANAVSLSLWEVSGKSTTQFMVSVYSMVQEKGIRYAEAISETKRRFINGDFGEKYRSPYYWAPFVYYGN